MRRSEQLQSRLWLAADATTAAGVLLQKLPAEGGRARVESLARASAARALSKSSGADLAYDAGDDATAHESNAWIHLVTLAATITRAELLDLEPLLLTRRLFWQEALQPIEPLAPRFQCRCSRERIGRMLISLGREEIDSIITEFGQVEVTCDFCNARQTFDPVDVVRLFATGASDEVASGRPH